MNKEHLLDFYVQPGARKLEVSGRHGDRIKIKLRAQAMANKANEELIEFLAEKLELPKKNIEIVYGQTSRLKTLKISGLEQKYIFEKLNFD